jgi:hypothetical protein
MQGDQFTQAVAGYHLGRASLSLQGLGQQAFDHKKGRLGVAGVVQIAEVSPCRFSRAAGAYRQQVTAQQSRGLFEAFPGSRQLQNRLCHAHFLRALARKHPGNAHAATL